MDGDNWIWRVTATQVEPYTTDVTQFLLAGKLEAQAVEVGERPMPFPENEHELFFFGPLDLGNTLTLQSSKRLLANLIDVTEWGQSQFRTWLELNVQRLFGEENRTLSSSYFMIERETRYQICLTEL